MHIGARETSDAGGRWLEVEVRDTGPGIPPEVVEKLGTPFALGAGVIGGAHITGSGLGLAICKGIASAHGGRISVTTAQSKGTTFRVRMRADLDAPAPVREDDVITGVAA